MLTNWRGLLAPGGISDTDRDALISLVEQLHESEAWTEERETRGWTDALQTGDEFSAFIDQNIAEVAQTLRTIGLLV